MSAFLLIKNVPLSPKLYIAAIDTITKESYRLEVYI
jgi:hypothetical protein